MPRTKRKRNNESTSRRGRPRASPSSGHEPSLHKNEGPTRSTNSINMASPTNHKIRDSRYHDHDRDRDPVNALEESLPKSTDLLPNTNADINSPSHKEADHEAQNSNPTTTLVARIQQCCLHRRLLLQRVRQGRCAAQHCLDNMTADQKSCTADQERETFHKLMQAVHVRARKQQQQGTAPTDQSSNRTSVSLRRGATVGKRMNAALSTLGGGHTVTASTVGNGTEGTARIGGLVTNLIHNKDNRYQMALTSIPAELSFASTSTSKTQSLATTNTAGATTAASMAQQQLSTTSRLSPTKHNNTHVATSKRARPGLVGKRRSPHTMMSSQQQQRNNITTSYGGGLTVHHMQQQGIHQQQLQLSHPFPRVVCRATTKLRERRDCIRRQLTQLQQNRSSQQHTYSKPESRIEKSHTIHTTDMSPSLRSLDCTYMPSSFTSRFTSQTSKTMRPAWLGPDLPPTLPLRRKTHWDTLLEEMRWMATDFVEERKWKHATARFLGKIVVADHSTVLLLRRNAATTSMSSQQSNSVDNMMEESQGTNEQDAVKEDTIITEINESGAMDCRDNDDDGIDDVDIAVDACCYQPLTEVETNAARQVAAVMSQSITELIQTLRKTKDTRACHCFKERQDDAQVWGVQAINTSSYIGFTGSATDVPCEDVEPNISAIVSQRAQAFDQACQNLDGVLKALNEIVSSNEVMGNTKTTELYGRKLLDKQEVLVKKVEKYWQHAKVGMVLRDVMASGKTVTACALLWRNRSIGPQLVLCSGASLMRWLHELSRFTDLNSKVLDHSHTNIFNSESIGPKDVLVCQYGSISQIGEVGMQSFRSIFIDCRYSIGYAGSRLPTVMESEEMFASCFGKEEAIPAELCSRSWWAEILDGISNCNVKRLLIENPGNDDSLHYLRGLSNQDFIRILARRTGFLLGTKIFESKYFSIEQAILNWSRRKIKNLEESGSKYGRVRNFLFYTCKPLHCKLSTSSKLEDVAVSGSKFISSRVELCEMESTQRRAYVAVCKDTRLALSRRFTFTDDMKSDDTYTSSAFALIRLRRQCLHANIEKVLCTGNFQRRCTLLFCSKCLSSSQPNVELAIGILRGSSKLRHLVSILVNECGLKIVGNELIDSLILRKGNSAGSKAQKRSNPKKVAILAALPEIQTLVSILLKSIGINNEIVSIPQTNAIEDSIKAADTWAQLQLILSRFNCGSSSGCVIVASLASVANDHGSLGVECADTVISLDEDWSGRGEILYMSLVSRCRFQREAIGGNGKCIFVRLINKDSCEEYFLGTERRISARINSDDQNEGNNKWPFPLDAGGIFLSPSLEIVEKNCGAIQKQWEMSRSCREQTFTFPGCNLFESRGQNLDQVLCTRERLPGLLSTPFDNMLFLPFFPNEGPVEYEINFLRLLLNAEEECSRWPFDKATTQHNSGSLSTLDFSKWIDPSVAPSLKFFEGFMTLDLAIDWSKSLPRQLGLAPMLTNSVLSDSMSAEIGSSFITGKGHKNESASSILFYACAQSSDQESGLTIANPPRANLFAATFSSSITTTEMNDGNVGSETTVYFPPLFPRMQECAALAKTDVESHCIRSPISPHEATASLQNAATEEESSRSDAASVLMDLSDDYGLTGMGALPLPRDSVLIAANYSTTVIGNTSSLMAYALNEWLTTANPCDPEEFIQIAAQKKLSDVASDGIVLFVSRVYPGLAKASIGRCLIVGANAANSDLNSSGPPGKKNSAFESITVPGSSQIRPHQLMNKKDAYRQRLLSNLRQSGLGSTIFEAPIFRVAAVRVRNKVSERLVRQGWTSSAAFDAGPGLPLIISKPHTPSSPQFRGMFDVDPNLWTSVVKRLKNKNATTGEESIELATAQWSALRRSLTVPCRVDFGPFNCGFLSSPTGMTVVAHPRPRVGVALPMGVKICHSEKDQTLQIWRSMDDKLLQSAAIRYGMNWIVAARVVSGYQDLVVFSQKDSRHLVPQRSARSCRDRWQRLARNDPSLVVKGRHSDRFTLNVKKVYSEGGPGRRVPIFYNTILTNDDSKKPATVLLIPPSDQDIAPNKNANNSTEDVETTSKRRNFLALTASITKRKSLPPIPGSDSSSVPAVVPCHTSHEQAVQASTALARPNGGLNDMWPLQLLEVLDRQRDTGVVVSPSQTLPNILGSHPKSASVASSHVYGPSKGRNHTSGTVQSIRHAPVQQMNHVVDGVMGMPMLSPRSIGLPLRSTDATGEKISMGPVPSSLKSFAPPPTKPIVVSGALSFTSTTGRMEDTAATAKSPAGPDDRGRSELDNSK